jgi:hypothetical protein
MFTFLKKGNCLAPLSDAAGLLERPAASERGAKQLQKKKT